MNNNLIADEVLGGWEASSNLYCPGRKPDGSHTGGQQQLWQPVRVLHAGRNPCWGLQKTLAELQPLNQDVERTCVPIPQPHSWFNDNVEASGDTVGSQPWKNPSDYTNQYGNFRRNLIYGPDLTNINFSLGKSFDILPDRGVKFQIRAEATNILNHPSFGQPGNKPDR